VARILLRIEAMNPLHEATAFLLLLRALGRRAFLPLHGALGGRAFLALLGAMGGLALLGSTAHAQTEIPARQQFGEYTVYYTAVKTDALPESMLRKYRLPPPRADAVLLNVAVQLGGKNVPADVEARVTNLADETHRIRMRATEANNMFAYLGVVHLDAPGVLTFELEIRPRGAEMPLRVAFQRSFEPVPETTTDAGEHGVRSLER
jgi:hypothetical protein